MKYVYDENSVPEELQSMLKVLSEAYDIQTAGTGIELEFRKADEQGVVEVDFDGEKAVIKYDKPHFAARGLSALISGLVENGVTWRESSPFEKFGIMLDCSRNAVMTVEHLKKWLSALAMLGYNMVMLYTEDTYELPDEPYFGYLRGRYTTEELKELDDYAASLNIEMIGCIQTLGHLAHVLKWPAYTGVKDTASVMLVDEPATYELIEKMIAQFASCLKSKRIHVGMDETHDLGRGFFMDKFGYERGYDIFNRHLAKVVEICKKHGLKPMIWSDMYFRMGSPTQEYYYENASIPDDVKSAIPKEVELVYWDYYHDNEEFYIDYINKHRDLDRNILLGSGVWTWAVLWYDHTRTVQNALPSIRASRKTGLTELFFTMWGDNGAYCEFDSAMAGLTLCSDHAYCGDDCDEKNTAKRFESVFGGNYKAVVAASEINDLPVLEGFWSIDAFIWENPITAPDFKERRKKEPAIWEKAEKGYRNICEKLNAFADQTEPVDMNHALNLARYFQQKISWRLGAEKAYAARDAAKLAEARDNVDCVIESIDNLLVSFRRQWQRRNKPFGLEILQERFGGQKECYREIKLRLSELIDGKITSIPEIED